MAEKSERPLAGTVFTPGQVRVLKFAVIAMGVLLVAGFAFVLATIVYQASRPVQYATVTDAPPVPGEGTGDIELSAPFGADVNGISLDGDRLAVHLGGMGSSEIAVIDLATGEVIAHVKVKPQKP